jgi:YD repeat-containing protein
MKIIVRLTIVTTIMVTSAYAGAAETVTYTYDAKGRLVKTVRSGSVNNGVTAEFTHDKVDNRTRVKVTGAPS